MFPAEQRRDLAAESIAELGLSNVTVEILTTQKYLASCAAAEGVTHLVRGLPDIADFKFEHDIYQANRLIEPSVETVFIMCDKEVQQVRSTMVRSLVGPHGWVRVVKPMVSKPVLKALVEKHTHDRWLKFASFMCSYLGDASGKRFEDAEGLWEKLKSRYAHRPFHNFFHILRLLEGLESGRYELECPNAVAWAAWFHDYYVSFDTDIPCETSMSAEFETASFMRCEFGVAADVFKVPEHIGRSVTPTRAPRVSRFASRTLRPLQRRMRSISGLTLTVRAATSTSVWRSVYRRSSW